MSLSPCDVVVSVSERLEELGYSFHEGKPAHLRLPGCTNEEEGCWFCWSVGGDVEVGETHSDSLAAVMDAMDHLAKRVRPMESALKVLVMNAPEQTPELEDYDDTESAFNNGCDCAAYAAGEVAQRGLLGLMPEDQGVDVPSPNNPRHHPICPRSHTVNDTQNDLRPETAFAAAAEFDRVAKMRGWRNSTMVAMFANFITSRRLWPAMLAQAKDDTDTDGGFDFAGQEEDRQFLVEGLVRLRETKVEALKIIRTVQLPLGKPPFEERDFGIPQIDRLLERLEEAGE